MEGLIFGGAYLRREICVSKSIGLALYLEGRFNGGFFVLPLWRTYIWRGLYMEGLICRHFTVTFLKKSISVNGFGLILYFL